jgi:hypothetical protein
MGADSAAAFLRPALEGRTARRRLRQAAPCTPTWTFCASAATNTYSASRNTYSICVSPHATAITHCAGRGLRIDR